MINKSVVSCSVEKKLYNIIYKFIFFKCKKPSLMENQSEEHQKFPNR